MAKSEQRRQHKLAKKQAKVRRKRKEAARVQQQLASLAGKMTAASHGRIIRCGVTEAVTSEGMGYVLIARQGPMGQVAIALIMVDVYCLGVKDALGTLRSPSDAEEMFEQLVNDHELKPVSPGLARGLVEGAIEYARSLGFEPHPDYRKLAPIWGDIEAEPVEGHYEFGKEGKPLYVRGPFDDVAKQQYIVNTLEKNVGSGNYNVTMLGSGTRGPWLESYDEDDFDDEDLDEADDDEGLDDESEVAGRLDNTIDAPEYRRIDSDHP